MHLHTPAGQAVAAHADGLLPLTQTAMLVRGDLAFHDYEGVAVDLERARAAGRRSRRQERDDPAQPRHAGGRPERRRMLRPALFPRARVPGADHGAVAPATTSTTRRRARPKSPPSRARSGSRWPPTCSPGRRSSARRTGSTRGSRAEASRRKLVGERGFEPPAPASRRQCSTRLSYSPTDHRAYAAGVKARLDSRGGGAQPRNRHPDLIRGLPCSMELQASPAQGRVRDAQRLQPFLDPDHFFARGTGAGGGFLGGLDLAPVGEVGRRRRRAPRAARLRPSPPARSPSLPAGIAAAIASATS